MIDGLEEILGEKFPEDLNSDQGCKYVVAVVLCMYVCMYVCIYVRTHVCSFV